MDNRFFVSWYFISLIIDTKTEQMQKPIAILLLLLSQIVQLSGQNLEISPPTPNPNDCIYIYTKAQTANLSFTSETQITEEGNNITIETCFRESSLNAIGNYCDTIALGPMKVGEYNLNYLVSTVRGEEICEEVEQSSTKLTFEVTNDSSSELACNELEVNAFPNPIDTNNYLTVTANETISQIDVFDATGSFIYGKDKRGYEYYGNSDYLFPVPGVYYLRVNGNSPNSVTVKIIKL